MRFKKGSKVEVLNKREVPSGSWWCAEIISASGHAYYVSYDRYQQDMVSAIERVPRKAIRPWPPSVKGLREWVPGDVVEVFDNSSWKLAEVSSVVGACYFFVRPLGSSREFKAHTSELRLRQSWQDNKWVVIQKDSGKYNGGKLGNLSKEGKLSCQISQSFGENHNIFEESPKVLSRSVNKRPLILNHSAEACTEARKKVRAVEKDGRLHRMVAGHLPRLREKVDAVASPQTVLGEKCMIASLNNRLIGFSNVDLWSGMQSADNEFCLVTSSESSDAQSTSSSVGSCSTSSRPHRSSLYPVTNLCQDLSSDSNDAETSFGSGREPPLPKNQVSAADTHRLELHAYRSTMMALYASGSISWEQEALMTNLRLMLNISNEEHLLELKNLVASEIATFTHC